MPTPIGMITWAKEGSVALQAAKEWVTAVVVYDDGSTTRQSFVRTGQQVGGSWFPAHLAGIPEVCSGGRSAGGRSWGLDFDQFRRGLMARRVANDPKLAAAARLCQATLSGDTDRKKIAD